MRQQYLVSEDLCNQDKDLCRLKKYHKTRGTKDIAGSMRREFIEQAKRTILTDFVDVRPRT